MCLCVGKSTLSKVLAGSPNYVVTGGSVTFKGLDLLSRPVDHRAVAGVFLAFQYPLEIPMVSGFEMLRTALNERRKWEGKEEMDPAEFENLVKPLMKVSQYPYSLFPYTYTASAFMWHHAHVWNVILAWEYSDTLLRFSRCTIYRALSLVSLGVPCPICME